MPGGKLEWDSLNTGPWHEYGALQRVPLVLPVLDLGPIPTAQLVITVILELSSAEIPAYCKFLSLPLAGGLSERWVSG